ncbi:MAG: ABC transporter permease [Chloroflexi bacterium]|jgi:peptide/nickel transport system permease protein|nr:ABC transporter permease [Chloroflexota bacterium]
MIRFIIRRFFQMILVLFIVSLMVFLLSSFTGDPVYMLLPPDATLEEIADMRILLGLDKPLYVQYAIFLQNILKGDFGNSYVYNKPALGLILERMPATMEVVAVSTIITILIALPLGVFAGSNPKSTGSKSIMFGSLIGISLPSFLVGMLLIYLFSVTLGWLPTSGRSIPAITASGKKTYFTINELRHVLLPSITLALGQVAMLIRLLKAGLQETMQKDFIKFAKSKGVSRRNIVFGHALRNALTSTITVFGLSIGDLIAFTTITETIFAWPGMGRLLLTSINVSDRPVIIVYIMVVSVIFVVINFFVDILYTVIDPRIKLN